MKKENWVIVRKGADFEAISKKYALHPLTARLIRNRDVLGDDAIDLFLNGGMGDLFDPMLMKDMDKAVKILSDNIADGAKIRIIGDYDIDGVMGAYILKRGLMGAGGNVSVDIPDRFIDGYGVSDRMIDRAHEDGIDLIVTVDNGIAAHSQIERAKDYGITVVVTDHHEVNSIPDAPAVVDIKRGDCKYPNKDICGGATAFKLITALYKTMDIPLKKAEELIQYAAFATVGDIVDLLGENRVMVREGLKLLRKTDNMGLSALCRACAIKPEDIDAYRIGFVLGPCINASGRLDTAKDAFKLLDTSDENEAELLAEKLRKLNDRRKALTDQGLEWAKQKIEAEGLEEKSVFVLYLPDCHEAVAGIVASRIKDMYYRPVYVITPSGNTAKGSGRSIEGYSMFEELSKCGDLLTRFGGHKMAGGFTIPPENIEEFAKRMNENCPLAKEDMIEKVTIDAEAPLCYMTEKFTHELEILEPFGKGNKRPLFAKRNVLIENPRLVGTDRNILTGSLINEEGNRMQVVCFNDGLGLFDKVREGEKVTIAYYPSINEYMGHRSVQIVITHFS